MIAQNSLFVLILSKKKDREKDRVEEGESKKGRLREVRKKISR